MIELKKKSVRRTGKSYLEYGQIFNETLFMTRRYKPELKETNFNHLANFFRALECHLNLKTSPHKVRHTFATELAKTGRLKTLQVFLGHTDIRTTMIYVHPDLEEMRNLASLLPYGRQFAVQDHKE